MTHSMTAFSTLGGHLGVVSWQWEMRGVNARGLDLRLRVPEGMSGVEAALRETVSKALGRGNVTVNLRLAQEDGAGGLTVDQTQLDAVLTALDAVQERAFEMGVTLGQPTAADVIGHRGVLTNAKPEADAATLQAALIAQIPPLLDAFVAMRASEGAALHRVLSEQFAQIADLTERAAIAAAERAPKQHENLSAALRRVLEDVSEVEPARVAQELALLAVKSDVTEEIDRLRAHVQAGRALLGAEGPIGRKLDFLAQEFNREANTLCAKAQGGALTVIGLDLKAVIDQMREQIQNVE